MANKRPTPHERRAARARHEQEHGQEELPTQRTWFQIVAWILVIGLVFGGVGTAVLVLID